MVCVTASIKETPRENIYTDLDGNTISTEYSLKSSDFVVLNGISQSVGYPNELVLDHIPIYKNYRFLSHRITFYIRVSTM